MPLSVTSVCIWLRSLLRYVTSVCSCLLSSAQVVSCPCVRMDASLVAACCHSIAFHTYDRPHMGYWVSGGAHTLGSCGQHSTFWSRAQSIVFHQRTLIDCRVPSNVLPRKSTVLTRKSSVLLRKSNVLTRKSSVLLRKSNVLIRKSSVKVKCKYQKSSVNPKSQV